MASVNIAITAGNIGFTMSVQTEWIETETTQEGVLKRLDAHDKELNHVHNSITGIGKDVEIMPRTIDSKDRWRKSEEEEYQRRQAQRDASQDMRIQDLEESHKYEHKRNHR